MRDNDWGNSDYPLLPGHEGVGEVVKIGSAVTSLSVGTRVAIGWMRDACKTCNACEEGQENVCAKGYQGLFLGPAAGIWGDAPEGYNAVGGCFARVQRIESRFACRVPDAIPSEVVCPLICGGGTVFEPLVTYGFPGARVGILSIGGLGTAAIKLANLLEHKVVAVSSSPGKRDAALAAGAQEFVSVDDDVALGKLQGSLDFIIETSPAKTDVAKALTLLKINGTYVRVGIPAANEQVFEAAFIPMIFQQQKIAGSIISGMKNFKRMLDLVAVNLDKVEDSDDWKTEHMKMEKVNEAMTMLQNRNNKGYRFVLEW